MTDPLADTDQFVARVAHLLQLERRTAEAQLLAKANVRIEQTDWQEWNGGTDIYTVYVDLPSRIYATLDGKAASIEKTILQKAQFLLRTVDNIALAGVVISPDIPYDVGWRSAIHSVQTDDLIAAVGAQLDLMIDVATGGSRISEVNEQYRVRREHVRAGLSERGLEDPNPYDDLWAWYKKWSCGDLPSYQSRREYLRDLYGPLIARLNEPQSTQNMVFPEPTGWAKVDRLLSDARRTLERASTEIEYQKVGLVCRETLVAVAQVLFDPALHVVQDGVDPSATDAKRMLDAYIATELSGGSNEAARKYARSALTLANELVHRPTAGFRDAAICAEATSSVVNLLAVISGRRDP